jgi:arylsulfatase A-like enzyme
VPLVLRFPRRLPAGRVIETPVSLLDLAPTLLELLGVDPAAGDPMQGKSRVSLIEGEAPADGEPIFLFRPDNTEIPGEQYAVRHGDWKLIRGPGPGRRELFDLAADPEEREDRSGAEAARVRELEARLDAWLAAHGRSDPPPATTVSPEDLERLRALGYVP